MYTETHFFLERTTLLILQSSRAARSRDDAADVQAVPLPEAKPTGVNVGVDGDAVDGDDAVVLEGVRGQAPPGSRPVSWVVDVGGRGPFTAASPWLSRSLES
eukprot:COSAG04_NODE_20354_length_395_cov_1.043919_1_plen_101_part_10